MSFEHRMHISSYLRCSRKVVDWYPPPFLVLFIVYSYLEFLQTLEEKVDQNWAEISSSLEEIRQSLLSRKNCLVNITADGNNLIKSEKFIGKFLDLLPNQPVIKSSTWNARLSSDNEAIVIPTQVSILLSIYFVQFFPQLFVNSYLLQVNYVGKAANIYETGYQLNGSAYVISKFISNTWLWDRVRVSGGAYGGFCDFDTHSGTRLCYHLFRHCI